MNKKSYKLIAFDMDGTLLNSQKQITLGSIDMINRAFDEGKEVVLATGRCIAELKEYLDQLPRLRYIVCVSGALVYDVHDNIVIYENAIPKEIIKSIFAETEKEEMMIHILNKDSIVQKGCMQNMAYYGMGVYTELFHNVATEVDDLKKYYYNHEISADKINLYHHSTKGRTRTKDRLKGLDIVMADAEKTSVEISSKGTTKGTGLEMLCSHLNINMSETIAVGDADNDLDVLKRAGLSIAMGNANDKVKEICDVQVKDCDHEGCSEAIEKYLL